MATLPTDSGSVVAEDLFENLLLQSRGEPSHKPPPVAVVEYRA